MEAAMVKESSAKNAKPMGVTVVEVGMKKPMMGAKPLDFKAPEEADMPEVEEGEEFEMPAKFVKKPDGMFCLVEVAGGRMPGYDKPEGEDMDQESMLEQEAADLMRKSEEADREESMKYA